MNAFTGCDKGLGQFVNESGIALARQFDQAMDEMARDWTIGRLTAAYPTLDSDSPRR